MATDLCAEKANFMAHSAMSGEDARIMTAIIIYAFMYINAFMIHKIATGDISVYRTKLIVFNLSTIICAGIATCIATYYFTVQRQFYCTAEFEWKDWNKEWTLTGIMLGIPGCIVTLDWLFVLSHIAWEREVDAQQQPTQWSSMFIYAFFCMIRETISSCLCLISGTLHGLIVSQEWAIKKLKALGKRVLISLRTGAKAVGASARRQWKRRGQLCPDLEQSQPLASKMGSGGVEHYGTMDKVKKDDPKEVRPSEYGGTNDKQSDRAPSYHSQDPNAVDKIGSPSVEQACGDSSDNHV